eukprot:gene6634-12173_t
MKKLVWLYELPLDNFETPITISTQNYLADYESLSENLRFTAIADQPQNRKEARDQIKSFHQTAGDAGKQTINRDAKVAGGIKYFASDSNSILKWTLNRAAQARNTEAPYDLAEIKRTDRPFEIIKSGESFVKIHNVITQEYLNPFDPGIDANQLYNLSFGWNAS